MYETTTTMTEAEAIGFIIGFYSIVFVVLLVFMIIFSVIPNMFIFSKAGEAKWKAWVPFLNQYTRSKIVFGEKNAWWFMIDMILGGLFNLYLTYNEARAFGKTPMFAVMHILFTPITNYIMAFDSSSYQGTQKFLLDEK